MTSFMDRIWCFDCFDTKQKLVWIMREDLCTQCRDHCNYERYCLPCYRNRMEMLRPCMRCHTLTRKDSATSMRLEHPDHMVHPCFMCHLEYEAGFPGESYFCKGCLRNRRICYMCPTCFQRMKDAYSVCFYCPEIIRTSEDKLNLKRI